MKIGVAGIGTIGSKLVEYLAEKGFEVIAYNWRNVSEKRMQFTKTLEKKVQFNKVSYENMALMKSRVFFSDNLENFRDCYMIIESMREDYTIKMDFYKKLLPAIGDQYILATTTSSLSLDRLAQKVSKSRFFGLHFFNPPTKMKLIELSFLDEADEIKENVFRFLSLLDDKEAIEIPPIQGYIVNTILFANINFALNFHMNTKIPIQNIDEAMKLGTNVPMGPFELSDYIGNDISLQILEELYDAFGKDLYKPAELLVKMVKENKLGRKTAEGFYHYSR